MISTVETLLDNVVYGQASGNYDGSSQLFYSDAVRAANYYGGQGSIQTAGIRVTSFIGRVVIEATLADQPSIQAAWFEIAEYGDLINPSSSYYPATVTGNFTFIRARVEGFDAGTINFVNLTY